MVLIFKSNVDIFYFEFTTLCTKKCSGTFFSGILQNSKLYKFTTFLYFYIHGLNFKTKAICEFTKFLHIFWFFNTITKPLCEFIRVFSKKNFCTFWNQLRKKIHLWICNVFTPTFFLKKIFTSNFSIFLNLQRYYTFFSNIIFGFFVNLKRFQHFFLCI